VLEEISRSEFITIHSTHWGIESFHRALKQVCGIGRFQVREGSAIKTHTLFGLSLCLSPANEEIPSMARDRAIEGKTAISR
jgi:hypothetical protein